MRIRLVDPGWGWWCSWTGRILHRALGQVCDIDMGSGPDLDADINHWLTWHKGPTTRKTKLDTTHFTHLNPRFDFDIDEQLGRFDHLVAMSQHGRQTLLRRGIHKNKITVIYPGNDEFRPKEREDSPKVIIGISGQTYDNGRKREWLPLELVWRMDLSRFKFLFLGRGWQRTAFALQSFGVEAVCDYKCAPGQYPGIFPQFDLYLATGFAEGGPMGVIQALGCGVPVLSPDYGFAHDFKEYPSVIVYHSIDHLVSILKAVRPYRAKPLRLSWQEWARKHLALWQSLVRRGQV